eukprot:SAG31_NODE_4444_length_3225_cov_2.086052_2_plen_114_part_00
MWAFQLGLRGLRSTDAIVVYDDTTGMAAARAFWFLEYLGHQGELLVLNGGVRAWAEQGLAELERGAVEPTPSNYRYAVQNAIVATWEQVIIFKKRGPPQQNDCRHGITYCMSV